MDERHGCSNQPKMTSIDWNGGIQQQPSTPFKDDILVGTTRPKTNHTTQKSCRRSLIFESRRQPQLEPVTHFGSWLVRKKRTTKLFKSIYSCMDRTFEPANIRSWLVQKKRTKKLLKSLSLCMEQTIETGAHVSSCMERTFEPALIRSWIVHKKRTKMLYKSLSSCMEQTIETGAHVSSWMVKKRRIKKVYKSITYCMQRALNNASFDRTKKYKTISWCMEQTNLQNLKPQALAPAILLPTKRPRSGIFADLLPTTKRRRKNSLLKRIGWTTTDWLDALRMRRKRAKVNLDNETIRVWDLLLKDMNCEDIDGRDEEEKKKWQDDREIFRDLVNSLIAKMNEMQGERQFQPWKGSVLDSIIGAFLAQNVSDHLSSSAFMSLAARYPFKPRADVSDDHRKVNPSVPKGKSDKDKENEVDWDKLRKQTLATQKGDRTANTMDSVDWEAVRRAKVEDIAETIKKRGMNNRLAERIQAFLNRLINDHRSLDMEWLRDIPPDKAKEFLLSIYGFQFKSTDCVQLLTLHHRAFPVDTNVGRIAVRLGWVPLLESVQLHLLKLYPGISSIQKYLWPRLCKMDHRTLYALHCHLITLGKVKCNKHKPKCQSCPMQDKCMYFASANARLGIPAQMDRSSVTTKEDGKASETKSPLLVDVEDLLKKADETNRLSTKHQVYVIPDSHELLKEFDKREIGDPSPYLLAIWSPGPGETINPVHPPERRCSTGPCCDDTCSECNSIDEDASQIAQGTILIPCKTASRGSFPLNGTFFQLNEVFADHGTSLNPIIVQKDWLENMECRTAYFGSSVPSIFRGLNHPETKDCFGKGFLCMRGFDRGTRNTHPLNARLHLQSSFLVELHAKVQ